MNPIVRRSLACMLLVSATLPAAAQNAASDYPRRPIKVIVPNPPAGTTDAVARKVVEPAGTLLKQTMVFEYKPAAAGVAGTSFVAKSPADGYTLLVSTSSPITLSPVFTPGIVNYDPARELMTVAQVGSGSQVLFAPAAGKFRSVANVLEQARKNPGAISFATNGVGSIGHLLLEYVQKKQGVKLNYIPYAGVAPVISALVAGHVDLGLTGFTPAAPHVASGKLIPLAIAAASRRADNPDLATFGQLGVEGLDIFSSFARVFVPAGTPKPIIDKLSDVIVQVAQNPEVAKWLTTQGGLDMSVLPSEAAHKAMLAELAGWRQVRRELPDIKME